MYNIQQKIKNWENELQEYKKYDYNDKLKNYETIKDCTINFFLNDWRKHNEINKEYKTDYDYNFCLTIYANDEIIIEENYGGHNNYSDYIDLIEEYAKHLPFVYLEIANIALCDEDGYGRFWCNVNDKTYYMEYEEDWNEYVNYKSLNEKEAYENQKKRRKNHEMFKRWDKIRPIMGSEEIIIAEIPISKKDKESMPFIIKEEISIMKHSEPKLYPNYFIWIEYFETKKGEEDLSIIEADPNFYGLINLTSNINWINIELLENLEELYDLN